MGKIQVLDHGYIELIEHWGSDERIIEAARMSTGKGFKGWGPMCIDCVTDSRVQVEYASRSLLLPKNEGPCVQCGLGGLMYSGDEKLLRYLYENKHATPFEMAGLIVEVKAPIMVFREWHRHRTQSYNEMSARYTPIPNENYVPTPDRCLVVSTKNKQAGKATDKDLTHEDAINWLAGLEHLYGEADALYREGLELGVPKELARLIMPVGRYSRMRASAVLRNWLAFLTLRGTLKGPNAQWEIRQYADALDEILTGIFPRTMGLFHEGSAA